MPPLRLYLAASLFSPFERQRNSEVARRLVDSGFKVFLPQDVRTEAGDRPPADSIFKACVDGIDEADVIIGLVDGADVDSGTAWELGYAYARGRPAVILRSDYRSAEHGPINIMLECSSHLVIANQPRSPARDAIEKLVETLDRLVQEGKLTARAGLSHARGELDDSR